MSAVDWSGGSQSLQSWKNIRKKLTADLNDIEHLIHVVNFWSQCPISRRFLDWDKPEQWLDPWHLMHQNNFDECAISLGMFYTLKLSTDGRWDSERLQLMLIKNPQEQFQDIVLQVDDRYILNYEYNTVYEKINLSSASIIQQQYSFSNNRFSYPHLDSIASYSISNVTRVN